MNAMHHDQYPAAVRRGGCLRFSRNVLVFHRKDLPPMAMDFTPEDCGVLGF
jgi:hypothetical protein